METRNEPRLSETKKHFLSLGTALVFHRLPWHNQPPISPVFHNNRSYSLDAGSGCPDRDQYLADDYDFFSTPASPTSPICYQISPQKHPSSERSRPLVKRKFQSSTSVRREISDGKTNKKHTRRYSVLSVMSLALKNAEPKPVCKGQKEVVTVPEKPSASFSNKSFLSTSSTLNTSPLSTAQSTDIPKANFTNLSRSSLNTSISSSTLSVGVPCSQVYTGKTIIPLEACHEQILGKDKEEDKKEGTSELVCYSSEQISFFQEREYRIAKAWLEAEESRKAKLFTDNDMISLTPNRVCGRQQWTIGGDSNRSQASKGVFSPKSSLSQSDDNKTCGSKYDDVQDESVEKKDKGENEEAKENDDRCDPNIVRSQREMETDEKKSKRKRISAISNLSHGMRGWLSRRASNHETRVV